jgi:Kef-type K+ transport system membrane component KefB
MEFIKFVLSSLGDWGPVIMMYFVQATFIFMSGLGVVYIMGRMLELEKQDRVKNITAFIIMLIVTVLILLLRHGLDYREWEPTQIIWIILEFIGFLSTSTLLYVLIGWRLYDRVDSFLDEKFGQDEKNPSPKRTKKKATKKEIKDRP